MPRVTWTMPKDEPTTLRIPTIDAKANSTILDSTTDKGIEDNDDSEFETDDDMVEIDSSRITLVQKCKSEVLEDANNQNQEEKSAMRERRSVDCTRSHPPRSAHQCWRKRRRKDGNSAARRERCPSGELETEIVVGSGNSLEQTAQTASWRKNRYY